MCRIHNNRKKPNQILSSDWNKPIWKEKKLVEQTQVIVLSLNSNSSIATPIDLVTNSMHSMHLSNREFQRAEPCWNVEQSLKLLELQLPNLGGIVESVVISSHVLYIVYDPALVFIYSFFYYGLILGLDYSLYSIYK